MIAPMKRTPQSQSELETCAKKPKTAMLHAVVKLLEELTIPELVQLNALVTVRVQTALSERKPGLQKSKDSSDVRGLNRSTPTGLQQRKELSRPVTSEGHVRNSTRNGIPMALNIEYSEENELSGQGPDSLLQNLEMVPKTSRANIVFALKSENNMVEKTKAVNLSSQRAQSPVYSVMNNLRGSRTHPDYIAYRNVLCELEMAQKIESVKSIWKVRSTEFVGKFLLANAKWHFTKLPFSEEVARPSKHPRTLPDFSNSNEKMKQHLRITAVSQCLKLSKRCGGLKALQERPDDCSKFFDFCCATYKFTPEEIERMRKPGAWFSYIPNFVLIALRDKTAGPAITLWEHPDPTIIAKSLVKQAKYELRLQGVCNEQIREEGKIPHTFFGTEFQLFEAEQVFILRNSVLRNCAALAKLCGGIAEVRKRAEDCLEYIELATKTYRLTDEELKNACGPSAGKEMQTVDKNFMAFKKAQLEVEKAKTELSIAAKGFDTARPWTNRDISQVGRILLARAKVYEAEQKYRRKLLEMEGRFVPEGVFLGRGNAPMHQSEVEFYRRRAVADCFRLADRCGGFSELRARSDDCPKFLEHCISTFKLGTNDFDMRKKHDVLNNCTPFPCNAEYNALKAIDQEISKMKMSEKCNTLWEISDTLLIGRRLLARARLELVTQEYRRKELEYRGVDRRLLKKAIISFNLERLTDDEVQARREEALANCSKLAKRCGGLAKLLARSDDCSKFVRLSMDTYNITPDETGTWM